CCPFPALRSSSVPLLLLGVLLSEHPDSTELLHVVGSRARNRCRLVPCRPAHAAHPGECAGIPDNAGRSLARHGLRRECPDDPSPGPARETDGLDRPLVPADRVRLPTVVETGRRRASDSSRCEEREHCGSCCCESKSAHRSSFLPGIGRSSPALDPGKEYTER